jgi:hypothetical protein
MPTKPSELDLRALRPRALGVVLAVSFLAVAACGGSANTPSKTPGSSGGKSSGSTTSPKKTKLDKVSGKGAIKNVFTKTSSGDKISLFAKSPGHEVMEQTYDSNTKSWSAPTSIFKDDTRFCHAIKLKSKDSLIAATVSCSISAQDKTGTQSSYVLASTDGKTWKRVDLTGASGKPDVSPGGKYVAWTSPTGFLLWSPATQFKTVKYTQSQSAPAIGVMQDDGSLTIIKATPQKHGFCVISFQSASVKAPAVKAGNSTRPIPNHPQCMASSAKLQGTEIVGNFQQTVTTKVNDKKQKKTSIFSDAFRKLPNGSWIVKTSS